jgi:hypothetical protein
LYRYWAGSVPHHPTRAPIDEEHKVILDAALAGDADLLTQHLEPTARPLEPIAPEEGANRRGSTRLPADGLGAGDATPGR